MRPVLFLLNAGRARSIVLALGFLAIAGVLLAKPAEPQRRTQSKQSVVAMAKQIQKEITSLTNYGVFDSLSYSIRNYEVTLKGYASRPSLKDDAERVIKKIEGVEKVYNKVEVLPAGGMDDGIRARVYAAIYFYTALSRYNPNRGGGPPPSLAQITAGITNDPPMGSHPIHIIVKGGNVILTRVVDNEGDKNLVGMRANSVSGVFSVKNDLVVATEAKPKKAPRNKE